MDKNAYYYQYPMMKEFDAQVLSCTKGKKGYELVLDHTAFYPEGGGQPNDIGTIENGHVYDVQEKDDTIVHFVDTAFSVGQSVHGIIDWKRRFLMMQSHSGEHIVSGLVHKYFGYDNVGFHLDSQGLMTVDWNGKLSVDDLAKIEREANQAIYEDIPLTILWPDDLNQIAYRSKKELEGNVRIVQIGDYDSCACCGTHVQTTGQIGLIKIISHENYKQGIRIQMVCGSKAFLDYQQKHNIASTLSPIFSVPTEKIVDSIQKFKKESEEKSKTIRLWQDQYIALKTKTLPQQKIQLLFEQVSGYMLREFCNYVLEHTDCEVAIVVNEEGQYVMASQTVDLKTKVKELNSLLSGRGGGQKEMVQGSFQANQESIKKVIQEWNDSL